METPIDDYSQLHVVREVFLDEDYGVGAGPEPRTIVDLGSNIGASIIYFRLRHPAARIIGVEPDPVVFATLERNVAPFPGIELANVAVAEENGTTTFHRYPDSWVSSLVERWPSSSTVTVPTRTLDTILDDFGLSSVDLLKIDIEGGEWDVLTRFGRLDDVRTIVGEVHQIDSAEPHELLGVLDQFDVSVTLSGAGLLRFIAQR